MANKLFKDIYAVCFPFEKNPVKELYIIVLEFYTNLTNFDIANRGVMK